jgi:hypothetical protein
LYKIPKDKKQISNKSQFQIFNDTNFGATIEPVILCLFGVKPLLELSREAFIWYFGNFVIVHQYQMSKLFKQLNIFETLFLSF